MLDKNNLHDVYLALGSNLGDKDANINRAVNYIQERIGEVVSLSAFYRTEPIGFESENYFLNAACCVKTKLHPLEVLQTSQIIEKELGRTSKSDKKSYADRIIDIDILLFDEQIVTYPHLVLPHPHLHERAFVLLPLAEIAGELVHPILRQTMSELLSKLNY